MRKQVASVSIFALLVGLIASATSITPPRFEPKDLSIDEAVKLGFVIKRELHDPISTVTIKAPEVIDGDKYLSLLIYLYNKKEMVTHYSGEGLNLEPSNRVPLRSVASLRTHQISMNRKYVTHVQVMVFYERRQYSFSVPVNGL